MRPFRSLMIGPADSAAYSTGDYLIFEPFSQSQRKELFRILTREDFFKLETTYLPEGGVADDMLYTLEYIADACTQRVTASGYCMGGHGDCAPPKGLERIIDEVEEIIEELQE